MRATLSRRELLRGLLGLPIVTSLAVEGFALGELEGARVFLGIDHGVAHGVESRLIRAGSSMGKSTALMPMFPQRRVTDDDLELLRRLADRVAQGAYRRPPGGVPSVIPIDPSPGPLLVRSRGGSSRKNDPPGPL